MNFEREIARLEGIQEEKQNSLKQNKNALSSLKSELKTNVTAIDTVNAVSALAQKSSKQFIEEVVSLAIEAVYGDDYTFELLFDTNRGQTTITPTYIDKYGNQFIDIKGDSGGGMADIISFGMRIALWAIQKPRTDSIFLLDEPGKALGQLLPKFADILKELSKELGIQFIVITHDDVLAELADKSYRVIKEGGISKAIGI